MLFQTLKESKGWGKMLEVDTVGALNDVIAKGDIQNLILVQEALQEKKMADIAQQIALSKEKKFCNDSWSFFIGKDYLFTPIICTVACPWDETASNTGG